MSSIASARKISFGSSVCFITSRSCSSYQSPSAIAFWKIVGLEVTPTTASSLISRFELAGLEHLARERVDPDATPVLGELMQS